MTPHIPVMLPEVLAWLEPRAGGLYVDGTVGAGGHAEAILEASDPDGLLLGLDRDPSALDLARSRLARFGERARLVHDRASAMAAHLPEGRLADGVLLDLGVSSMQLDRPERGFSFQQAGPLDMRMDATRGPTAADLVNQLDVDALARILRTYGEEPQAGRIARAVVAARPLDDTLALARVVEAATGGRRGRRIHPATRTFQALRIAVNEELAEVEAAVAAALDCVAPGGVVVAIAFHSLEDRIVKGAFARAAGVGESRDAYGRPVRPPAFRRVRAGALKGSDQDPNPRARSARLRAVQRLPLPTSAAIARGATREEGP